MNDSKQSTSNKASSDPRQAELFLSFEQRLDRDLTWALQEGGLYFEERGSVRHSLRRATQWLEQLCIRYAVGGGLALFAHGYRRFTQDIDVFVSADNLPRIIAAADGIAFKPSKSGRSLIDLETGVRVDLFACVADSIWPCSLENRLERIGILYLSVESLVSTKLTFGMGSIGRMRHVADIMELIREANLPRSIGDSLHGAVREKYFELWQIIADNPIVEE